MVPARAQDPPLTGHSAYLLSQLGRVARRTVSARLATHGLTMGDMAVLAVVAEEGAVSQAELGRRLGLDPSDISTLIDGLVAADRVERIVDGSDRRRRLIRATKRGRAALTTAHAVTDEVDAELLGPLPPTRRRTIQHDLVLLLKHARAHEDG